MRLGILAMILMMACTTQVNTMDDMHMGCQEDEVDVNGTCVPAEENNAGLFDQDLDAYVMYSNVSNGVQGFIAQPKGEGDYPGIIMIHEWWGLNDNIREMAKILAKEGYTVFAVDLYNGEVATTSSRAGELASSVRNNPEEAIATMQAAAAYLRNSGVERVGSLGWCFGGQQSLQLSLNEDMDATVIYYGHLTDNTTQLQQLQGPVLGIFGEEDGSISLESVNNFDQALDTVNVQHNIHIYPGVGHAFANPSGSNYAPQETMDAWSKTVAFLNENLK